VDNTIDEEKPSGTSAGFVFSASDADAGTTLVYTLTGQLFYINGQRYRFGTT
jgi:hypothetical protein